MKARARRSVVPTERFTFDEVAIDIQKKKPAKKSVLKCAAFTHLHLQHSRTSHSLPSRHSNVTAPSMMVRPASSQLTLATHPIRSKRVGFEHGTHWP